MHASTGTDISCEPTHEFFLMLGAEALGVRGCPVRPAPPCKPSPDPPSSSPPDPLLLSLLLRHPLPPAAAPVPAPFPLPPPRRCAQLASILPAVSAASSRRRWRAVAGRPGSDSGLSRGSRQLHPCPPASPASVTASGAL